MNMHMKMLKNDFAKKGWKNTILYAFMFMSVLISSLVVLMLTQLFTSISSMYEAARPPHFLQMHMGKPDTDDIEEFNKGFQGLTHSQIVPMIDVHGEDISVSGKAGTYTLADCRLDISLVRQNDGYDVLLDDERCHADVSQGEIGVPVIILDMYDISDGDVITIDSDGDTYKFRVSATVHDAMMNSTMCSSTRFLISDDDFTRMLGRVGETEYLIEAYFTDSSLAASYQTAYEQYSPALPRNGQAITYTIMFLLSALTDILTAMVFVLAGALLIMIALMCLKYVIMAELEDDITEIGTMKSIGIPEKGIRNLYLTKIRILMTAACVTGFIVSLLTAPVLTGHINRYFGRQPITTTGYLLSIVSIVLTYIIIITSARRVLSEIKHRTIVDLLVTGRGFGKEKRVQCSLAKASGLPSNLLIGIHEARYGYGIIFSLMLITTVLIMIPFRSLQTMKNKDFVTYMGSPVCSLLIEADQGEGLEERNARLYKELDSEIKNGHIMKADKLRRVRLQALNSDGEAVGVHIDSGPAAGRGIVYLSGSYPLTDKDISLSALMADELGKQVGDPVKVNTGTGEYDMRLCGIYQDVTSGGRTAKAMCDFTEIEAEKYIYQVDITEGTSGEALAGRLRDKLGAGYSIESMDSFLDQTLGGVTGRLGKSVCMIFVIGIVITVLMVLLFMELRHTRNAPALAEKIMMGIDFTSIRLQELYPMLIPALAGCLTGTLVTELLGEGIVGGLFSLLGLGISSISFAQMSAPSLLIPAGLVLSLAVTTMGSCMKISRIDVVEFFNK